jgi:hypothetical protein
LSSQESLFKGVTWLKKNQEVTNPFQLDPNQLSPFQAIPRKPKSSSFFFFFFFTHVSFDTFAFDCFDLKADPGHQV